MGGLTAAGVEVPTVVGFATGAVDANAVVFATGGSVGGCGAGGAGNPSAAGGFDGGGRRLAPEGARFGAGDVGPRPGAGDFDAGGLTPFGTAPGASGGVVAGTASCSVMMNWTRRLRCRLSSVTLGTSGLESPKPLATRRLEATP